MGKRPETVGDLAAFDITVTPPDAAPGATTSTVQVIVRKPDGTEHDDSAGVTASGTNHFRYVATARIDAPGPWRWRVNSNAGIIDSYEVGVRIPRPAFDDPLP